MILDQTTGLLALARFASAVSRLCLGPLLPILTLALRFDEASKPALLSAYSSGYILTQIGGGYLADKHGFAIIISATVGISAIILFYITSFATTATEWTRAFFAMGLVAGPLFPAGSSAISSNVPPQQRAASAAIVDAAASAGTCLAALTPLIAAHWGWRRVYQWTAVGLTLISIAVFTSFPSSFRSTTSTDATSNTHMSLKKIDTRALPDHKDHHHHQEGKKDNQKQQSIPALFQPAAILTYLCHSTDNFSKYSINAYAATMLVSKHQASQTLVGTILGTQEAVGVISKVMVGILWGSSSGSSSTAPLLLLFHRGTASAVGFFVQGLFLWAAFAASDEYMAGACLVVSAMAVGTHSIGFRPIYVEISPEHAGAVSGLGNTIASFASVLGTHDDRFGRRPNSRWRRRK